MALSSQIYFECPVVPNVCANSYVLRVVLDLDGSDSHVGVEDQMIV
jgi:hypothetical protein